MKEVGRLNMVFGSLRTTPARVHHDAAFAAVPGLKPVVFTCNNSSAVQVTISTQVGALLLQPSGTFNLPSGEQRILWAAKGGAGTDFSVSVSGGSLDDPIRGPLPSGGDGGMRFLTVS